jgi:hypothetical protein
MERRRDRYDYDTTTNHFLSFPLPSFPSPSFWVEEGEGE